MENAPRLLRRLFSYDSRVRKTFLIDLLFCLVLVPGCSSGREVDSPDPANDPAAESRSIEGRWVRPDGGYLLVVAIKGDKTRPQVSYFNPRPINVANARLTRRGEGVRLFVELQDRGYPGSYYDLSYDREADRLHGIYYQALQKQEYQVVFVRDAGSGEALR